VFFSVGWDVTGGVFQLIRINNYAKALRAGDDVSPDDYDLPKRVEPLRRRDGVWCAWNDVTDEPTECSSPLDGL
jgi:hypothetical protein